MMICIKVVTCTQCTKCWCDLAYLDSCQNDLKYSNNPWLLQFYEIHILRLHSIIWVRSKQPLCICKGKAAYNIPPPYLRIAKSLWVMGYEVSSSILCCAISLMAWLILYISRSNFCFLLVEVFYFFLVD